jgi:hypothetical protein
MNYSKFIIHCSQFIIKSKIGSGAILFLFLIFSAVGFVQAHQNGDNPGAYVITGRLVDSQEQPIVDAEIAAYMAPEEGEPLAETHSLEDGSFALRLSDLPDETAVLTINTHHFETRQKTLAGLPAEQLAENGSYHLETMTLDRRVTAGFWLAGLIFIGVLAIIALEKLHSTTASLAGISAVFFVTFLGEAIWEDLYIFSLERALTYINWEVIFLVMAMMIVIAIIEGTGVFQWTAFQAYRMSRGRSWLARCSPRTNGDCDRYGRPALQTYHQATLCHPIHQCSPGRPDHWWHKGWLVPGRSWSRYGWYSPDHQW